MKNQIFCPIEIRQQRSNFDQEHTLLKNDYYQLSFFSSMNSK